MRRYEIDWHYLALTDVSILRGVSTKLSRHSSNVSSVQSNLRLFATPRSCSSSKRETYSGLNKPLRRRRSGERRSWAKGRNSLFNHLANGTPKPFFPRRKTNG